LDSDTAGASSSRLGDTGAVLGAGGAAGAGLSRRKSIQLKAAAGLLLLSPAIMAIGEAQKK